ncbi:MAG TPA: hypothetical protein VGQ76_10095 [Thermoanaerobaculia bacterium]|jgi:hypothetical protein|nr:hypothetical protein [Thermoanaerobaculia bacterium]
MEDRERVAVIVAHPGHELVVYRWMELHRPLYFCLTEGSGGAGSSRIESTDRLLRQIGAVPGPIHGRFSDKEMYRLLLDKRVDVFLALLEELTESLAAADVTCVAGDAMEGFNPVHDVCRALIDAAVARIATRRGRVVRNYEFPLHDGLRAEDADAGALVIDLDPEALDRKLAAAREYPEMRDEVEAALARFGVSVFSSERLSPSSLRVRMNEFTVTRPHYEEFGEKRVGEGRYHEVIRYHEHVLPVLSALQDAALPD